MKKTAPPNRRPQRSNLTPPPDAEESLRASAAQEERRILTGQEERRTLAGEEQRRAQAARTPVQKPAHAALVPAALVPAALVPEGVARDAEGVQDNALDSGSAFHETPDCTAVHDCTAVQVSECTAVQTPAGTGTLTPRPCRWVEALQEDCRALLAWYKKYAEEAEQRQQQNAEDFAGWQQSRSSGGEQSRSSGVLRRQVSPPVRSLPLRAGKRTPLGRAHQHWDTPEGRLLVQVRLGEAVLLPKMRAQDADERGAVNTQIAAGLGLAGAVAAGLLTEFVVCWQATGRWPRRPVSVQMFWPGGKAQGDRLRGKHGPLLTHLREKARTHF